MYPAKAKTACKQMEKLEDILADVKKEGDTDPFNALEIETPSESPAENEPEVTVPAEGEDTPPEAKAEENVPFHEHPRWKARERELEELREQREADARAIAELTERVRVPDNDNLEVPESFQRLYGNDPEAYKAYRSHQEQLKEEIKQELIEADRQAREEAQATEKHWNQWVSDQLDSLAASGKTFDRNELVQTMLEYKPTTADGNFDFEAGYKIYEAVRGKTPDPAVSQARKQLASTVIATAKGDQTKPDYMTPAQLRNRSWSSLVN